MVTSPEPTVELGWATSSYSSGSGNCVQVRHAAQIGVRDSKNISGPALTFDPNAWRTFLTSLG